MRPNVNVTVCGSKKSTDYTYKTIILRSNLPFASQIGDPNCVYIIKWDFDLHGETIIIPENCILKFEGGILSNGTIVGQNTGIEAGLIKIFNINIFIEGTWNVAESYTEWFGAKGDGISDDSLPIQKTIDAFVNTKLQHKIYIIDSVTDIDNSIALILPEGHNIEGSAKYGDADASGLKLKQNSSVAIVLRVKNYSVVRNLNIVGYQQNDYSANTAIGIGTPPIINSEDWCKHSIFENCSFEYLGQAVNIAGFGNKFIGCSCVWCSGGFNIHGKFENTSSGDYGTSNILIGCLASRCKEFGFRFFRMVYSSLISCSGDSNGYNDQNLSEYNDSGYTYNIAGSCAGIKLIACGSEDGLQFLNIGNNANSVSIENCIFYVNCRYPVQETPCKYINIETVERVRLSDIQILAGGGDQGRWGIVNLASTYNVVRFEDVYVFGSKLNRYIFKAPFDKSGCFYSIDYSKYKKYGDSEIRETYKPQLLAEDEGRMYFDTDKALPAFFSVAHKEYIKADGNYIENRSSGPSYLRPTAEHRFIDGTTYFDKTIKKLLSGETYEYEEEVNGETVTHTEIRWSEADGCTAGIERSGLKSHRPTGEVLYGHTGFMYMQVDDVNGTFPIWASEITRTGEGTELDPYVYTVTWVKADGTNPDE